MSTLDLLSTFSRGKIVNVKSEVGNAKNEKNCSDKDKEWHAMATSGDVRSHILFTVACTSVLVKIHT